MSTEPTMPHPALRVFVIAVGGAAATALAFSVFKYPVPMAASVAVLAVLSAVAESSTFTGLKVGYVAISYPLTVAALVLYGPTTAAFVGLCGTVVAVGWRRRPPALKVVFNLGQSVLVDLASGWAYILLGGPLIAIQPLKTWADPGLLLALLVAAVIGPLVNMGLMVAVVWLSDRTAPSTILRTLGFGPFAAVHVALALLGLAVAQFVASYNWLGLVVFAFPVLSARQIFQHFARLQHDYPDTVRVLVNAIEAKDEYTKGHSERVAGLAVRFAEFLGLRDKDVERIQFAAMLHDLGKMGVRAEVLNKPARLSEEEFAEMKRHPIAALEFVARIPGTEDLPAGD